MTKETAEIVAKSGAYIVPTQITYEIVIEKSRELISKFIYDKFVSVCEQGYDAIRNAIAAGIPVGGGTDLTGTNTVYASGAIAYQAKAQGAMGAIVSFTKTNAEILKIEDKIREEIIQDENDAAGCARNPFRKHCHGNRNEAE